MKKHLPLFATLVAASVSADAAVITWGAATDVSGPSDVVTTGSLVQATNYGGSVNQTINGVTFAAASPAPFSYAESNEANNYFTGTTGSAAYDGALDAAAWSNGAGTLALTGLTLGNQYTVQIWYAEDRAGQVNRGFMRYSSDPTFASATLSLPSGTTALPNQAKFGVGTFTATGTTQDIYVQEDTEGFGQFNLFQLRDVTVPEPGTITLTGFMALALLRRRNRA